MCWRLSRMHWILTLVFTTADRKTRFSIINFVFVWILLCTGWCPELPQHARMGAWKPKMYTFPFTSTTFQRKHLGWYYQWCVDWPLPSTWTPRWKYLLYFLEKELCRIWWVTFQLLHAEPSCFSIMERLPTLARLFENTSIGLIIIARLVEVDHSNGHSDPSTWLSWISTCEDTWSPRTRHP